MEHDQEKMNADEGRPTPVQGVEYGATENSGINSNTQTTSWNSPSNAQNPQNWPSQRKWINVTLVSAQAMLSATTSTILAAGNLQIARQFHLTSTYTPNLPVGMYVLGLAIGPLCLGPFSELYGRRMVYVISFLLFTILNVGCATSPNITALSILRLASGACGSAGPTLGGASIGDMFTKADRGKAQALYALGPTLGPVLGPLIGAFIVDRTHTWRWAMWVMVIASGVVTTCTIVFLRETYAPFLLRKQARQEGRDGGVNVKSLFGEAIRRPFSLLLFSPICSIMSAYMALIFGTIYLHLITLPLLYGPESFYGLFSYRWQNGVTGLAYLGAGLGNILGTFVCAKYLNRSYAYLNERQKRNSGNEDGKAENRMFFLQIGMAVVPCGLVIFAWTAQTHQHWVLPLLGGAMCAVGVLMAFVCIQTYLVDVYGQYSASALAAMVASRSIGSCILSIVGFQLYVKLDYGWGTMVIAFMCIAALPVPLFIYKLGPSLRAKDEKRFFDAEDAYTDGSTGTADSIMQEGLHTPEEKSS